MIGRIHAAQLHAESDRVIARLFLPGEEASGSRSRAAEIVERVMALEPAEVERLLDELARGAALRQPDLIRAMSDNADVVVSRVPDAMTITSAQRTLLGAVFTAEFATEGAALCNPSAVRHPDQSGLQAGQLRVAVAVRSIGEGHLSSIGFAEAIIGPGRSWRFLERVRPPVRAAVSDGEWTIAQFRAAVAHEGISHELAHAVLSMLPDVFTVADVVTAMGTLPASLTARGDSPAHMQALRTVSASTYRAIFPAASALSQRVLFPAAAEEHHGMEDARFVQFTDASGNTQYLSTYTAYDGRHIAPRLLTSRDLVDFTVHRLAGEAAHAKGMALFPRLVGGRHLALSRTGGEDISLATSSDGFVWTSAGVVHTPQESWEVVQTGNCGSPIETERGWLVLVHGVGPMRTYSLGALLLDLDDPTIVTARTRRPLLRPTGPRRDGYVPNVVYSCGAVSWEGVLWIPFGIADSRIGVYSVGIDELVAEME